MTSLVERICYDVNLSENVRLAALELYSKVRSEEKDREEDVLAAAVVYMCAQMANEFRSLLEISKAAKVNGAKVDRCYRDLLMKVDISKELQKVGKRCEICGISIEDRPHNAKYCKECAEKRRNIPEEEIDPKVSDEVMQTIKELNSEGLTDSEIARQLGIPRATVNRVRRFLGLERNYEPGSVDRTFTQEVCEEIIKLGKEGLGPEEIAIKLGVAKPSVYYFLKGYYFNKDSEKDKDLERIRTLDLEELREYVYRVIDEYIVRQIEKIVKDRNVLTENEVWEKLDIPTEEVRGSS
ncbi:MAG: cyclin family protein [Candidatus Methanospirareceae archaeon]